MHICLNIHIYINIYVGSFIDEDSVSMDGLSSLGTFSPGSTDPCDQNMFGSLATLYEYNEDEEAFSPIVIPSVHENFYMQTDWIDNMEEEDEDHFLDLSAQFLPYITSQSNSLDNGDGGTCALTAISTNENISKIGINIATPSSIECSKIKRCSKDSLATRLGLGSSDEKPANPNSGSFKDSKTENISITDDENVSINEGIDDVEYWTEDNSHDDASVGIYTYINIHVSSYLLLCIYL
jgi:hypothetical protein